ncbi:Oxidoreductase, aldo/keto reductase family [plant metagenome]|uniref:Oxidoreductase, aldo/keto reductase family n=1 Tax=plant metagenome TaxID=1297885 RepID=A0A484RB69_9ZZZZ
MLRIARIVDVIRHVRQEILMTVSPASVVLPDGRSVCALGQGTWFMGESPDRAQDEIRSLQAGLDAGLALIDTAEMYADGGAEEIVGRAIAGRRDEVFLVSKVLPEHASRHGTAAACEDSLRRLKTDALDLYLLHWRGRHRLGDTVEAMEALQREGKIRAWGVSNLDMNDMQELLGVPGGSQVQVNQVLYNLGRRGIEFDLQPWCAQRGVAIMAYSPLEQGRLLDAPAVKTVAQRHGVTPAAVALAWTMRLPGVISIPKTASVARLRDNLASLTLTLSPEDLATLDAAFPAPTRSQPLEIL